MPDVFSIALKGDELNERFGGGIPKNSVIVIEGENGLGKSVLAQRLMYGVMQHGATATYLSTELNTGSFLNQMRSFNYGVKEKLLNQELLFLSIYPTFGNVAFEKNFLNKILMTRQLFEHDLIVFDTLSSMLIENEITQNNAFDILKFLKELTALNKIIIFCVNPKQVSPYFFDLLKTVADIYFRLEAREQYGSWIKLIHIERFTGAAGDLSTPIPYKVLAGLGLALEIASTS